MIHQTEQLQIHFNPSLKIQAYVKSSDQANSLIHVWRTLDFYLRAFSFKWSTFGPVGEKNHSDKLKVQFHVPSRLISPPFILISLSSHSHSCLTFLTSSRAHLLISPLFLPSSLGTDGSSLSFQVHYLVILVNICFFFCSVNPYHPSLQFGHFSFHVMFTHDVYDSKTCQLWVGVDYITSLHCAELVAVCSMMVGGGPLKEYVCVCLKGADEKEI